MLTLLFAKNKFRLTYVTHYTATCVILPNYKWAAKMAKCKICNSTKLFTDDYVTINRYMANDNRSHVLLFLINESVGYKVKLNYKILFKLILHSQLCTVKLLAIKNNNK